MTENTKPDTKAGRPKRVWKAWYTFEELPVCYVCGVPGNVKHTYTTANGEKIQRRYCPKCGRSFKSRYFPEAESGNS